MASRIFDKVLALQKQVVILEGRFSVGATGAVSNVKGAGIKSVTRTDTGDYSIVLDDQFNRFLGMNFTVAHATAGSGIAKVELADVTPDVEVAAGTALAVTCLDFAGSAADPANGSVVFFNIILRNSLVLGKGE